MRKSCATPLPVTTTTGEPYLPTRLVYRVSNAARVARLLKSQPSFAFDQNQDRWVWQIHPSLRRTRLKTKSSYWETGNGGTVLAACFFPSTERMDVYLSSAFRTALFLEFFDGIVPRDLALGEFIDQVNIMPKLPLLEAGSSAPPAHEFFPANDWDIPFFDAAALMDGAKSEKEFHEVCQMLDERRRTATLQPLERHRLEMFYADGPDDYYVAMTIRDLLALAQHLSPHPINPRQFLEEAMSATSPESFLAGRQRDAVK